MSLKDGASETRLLSDNTASTGEKNKGGTTAERKAAQALWAKNNRAVRKAEKEAAMAGKTKAPKEPKPKKEKAPKAEKPKKEPKLPKSAKKVERLIQEANANGSIDALDSAKRITKRYDAYLAAVGKVKEVTTECGLRLKAENAKFETVVTAPIPQGPKDEQEAFCVEQLSKIHVGWQDLSEVKGQIQVDRKEVKEKKSLALKSFERAIQEHKQLVLPMTGADD